MKKCSVIVPMYKGKQYIRECIDSVCRQTYKNFELILIDDGSPDDTYEFVKSIVSNYPDHSIHMLTQDNIGVAATRNKGIDLAEGEYIAFMDQDDCIADDYLEKLMYSAEENNSDIVLCGYVRRRDDGKILKAVKVNDDPFSKYRIVAPWARIYKKAFLKENGLQFLSTPCGEDTYLTIQAYALTEKISAVEKYTGYIWRYNPSSVSNTKQKSAKTADEACATYERILAALPEKRCSDPVDEEYFFIRGCIFYLLFSSYAESREEIDAAYDRYFSFLDNNFPDYMKNPHIGIFRPRCENASVRFVIWAFLLMKKIGISRAFARRRIKIKPEKS